MVYMYSNLLRPTMLTKLNVFENNERIKIDTFFPPHIKWSLSLSHIHMDNNIKT